MGRAGAVARPDTLSYPESFERDRVLVEQLDKQWDMSKSLTDDISYWREKGGLERAIEGARMSYDWFKLTAFTAWNVI